MGWGHGFVDGKEVGYAVNATCEHNGCNAVINRGVAYACGGSHGADQSSCGGHFCFVHLVSDPSHRSGFLCESCAASTSNDDESIG